MFNYLDAKNDENLNLNGLLASANETVRLLTVNTWQRILDNSITAVADKARLVTTLLEANTFIGFDDKGYVAIFTGKGLPIQLWDKMTWMDNITIGTYPNSELVTVTLDPTTRIIPAIEDMVNRFWMITMVDVTEIPWIKVSHGLSVEHIGYFFCVDTLTQLDIPGTHAFFGLIKDSGAGFEVVKNDRTIKGIMTIETPRIIDIQLNTHPS